MCEPQCMSESVGAASSMATTFFGVLMASYCNISNPNIWPDDYGQEALENGLDSFDFVVPGLLDSISGDKFTYPYLTEKSPNYCLAYNNGSCLWPRGKMIGGSGGIHVMTYLRGNKGDFDSFKEEGCDGWGWNDVLPYYKKSLEIVDDVGLVVTHFEYKYPLAKVILDAARERGQPFVRDYIETNHDAHTFAWVNAGYGRRMSTGKVYLSAVKDRTNLKVIKYAQATKINFEGNRAKFVTFLYKDEHEMTVPVSKEVVVSAGSIDSPKLLMLSGIGPKDELEKFRIPVVQNLPVGYNLHDHVSVFLFFKISKSATKEDLPLEYFFQYLKNSSGPLSSNGIFNNNGFKTTNRKEKYPNKYAVFAVLMCAMRPISKGRIKLRSGSYKDDPIIIPNYLDQEYDLKTLIEGIKFQVAFERSPTFRKYEGSFVKLNIPECDKMRYKSDNYWKCYAKYMTNTIYHPLGTNKMGRIDDDTTVLDPRLRVKGIQGLRVIDTSIFPHMVTANTYGPTVMAAEKGSDMIIEDWN
uniref:Glucose-methanol-choline oxidoreductase N-terminal domain-containing protein n=1 Tax=Megaselia scalaris TaxID=36166 RepID=T1GJ26_MEGSC